MKKLRLGKKTLHSINLQMETILKPVHGEKIEILKIKPRRTGAGNFLLAKFRTASEPEFTHSRYFAMVHMNGCCDIWLENPSTLREIVNYRNKMLSRPRF